MDLTVPRPPHRAKSPLSDAERNAERARLPWRARHISQKYNVGIALARVVAGMVFDIEARR